MMMHTFLGGDKDQVIEKVREPLMAYLRSHIDLIKTSSHTLEIENSLKQQGVEESLAVLAFERYRRSSSLIGTPETVLPMVRRLQSIGVDEVACLIDFGVPVDSVLDSLEYVNALRQLSQPLDVPAANRGLEAALIEFIQQKLPQSMVPKSILVVERLPESRKPSLSIPATAQS